MHGTGHVPARSYSTRQLSLQQLLAAPSCAQGKPSEGVVCALYSRSPGLRRCQLGHVGLPCSYGCPPGQGRLQGVLAITWVHGGLCWRAYPLQCSLVVYTCNCLYLEGLLYRTAPVSSNLCESRGEKSKQSAGQAAQPARRNKKPSSLLSQTRENRGKHLSMASQQRNVRVRHLNQKQQLQWGFRQLQAGTQAPGKCRSGFRKASGTNQSS